jgi:aspartyl-tRNA(Asn)/glutamyl-tRNA(Gln) amidotransferase subunit A
MSIHELTAVELARLLAQGELTSVEATEALLARIQATEGKIGAFLTLCPEAALAQARAADQARREGRAGRLTGVPIAVKDVITTAGVRTTCGSKILENFVPPFDATLVARLKAAGLPIVGKTNMDEFAMGSSTEHSAYQPTRNPWSLDHIPGGSSGGSAACVAAGQDPLAIGTDTGGSIRQPASHCGVVGLKPTYGRVSRYGLVAFASSLDQAGPFGKDVRDVAEILGVIAGHDPSDSTSLNRPVPDYAAALGRPVKGLRVGLPREFFPQGLDPEVDRIIKAALKTLEALGCELREVSLPLTEWGVATYYIIAPAEASSNLARYDWVKYGFRAPAESLFEQYTKSRSQGFGPEVTRRIIIGTYVLSAGYYDAYYKKASQVRTLLLRDFLAALGECDVLATPTAPTPAFRFGEKTDDPIQMYLSDVFTLTINLAGLPGLVLPAGLTQAGLPVGLQLIGRHFDEERLLQTAFALESELGFRAKFKPPEL